MSGMLDAVVEIVSLSLRRWLSNMVKLCVCDDANDFDEKISMLW